MSSVTTRENEQAAVETLASGKTYESFGLLDGQTDGSGVILAPGYDLDGRITAVNTLAGVNPVLRLDYDQYDPADNIRKITDTGAPGI